MTSLVWYLRGYWIVRICGAEPDRVLNRLTAARIPFWNICHPDRFSVEICVFSCDLDNVREIAAKLSCEICETTRTGLFSSVRGIFRPVLAAGICVSLLVLFVIPNYLLFFRVQGNTTVPDAEILRRLEELGVGFGTPGKELDPQWIKDHILNTIPQLQWITVTQNGCIAEVVVRERPDTPEVVKRRGFANVIAAHSGMITEQSVLAGQPLKKPGDFVLQGEMLVSGIVDLERVYAITYAQAEIYARTWRTYEAVIPLDWREKSEYGRAERSVWLEIGKERIKIFGNSGISANACDKMISRKTMSLPGGFYLPAALVIETVVPCDTMPVLMDQAVAADRLRACVEDTALSQMRGGEILQSKWSLTEDWGVYRLDGILECHEMIAKTEETKWNEEDFADD